MEVLELQDIYTISRNETTSQHNPQNDLDAIYGDIAVEREKPAPETTVFTNNHDKIDRERGEEPSLHNTRPTSQSPHSDPHKINALEDHTTRLHESHKHVSFNREVDLLPNDLQPSRRLWPSCCPCQYTKFTGVCNLTKISLLVGVWIFFTLIFLIHGENEDIFKQSFIAPGEVKNYSLNLQRINSLSVRIRIKGPFLKKEEEVKMTTEQKVQTDKLIIKLIKTYKANYDSEDGEVNRRSFGFKSKDTWGVLLRTNRTDFIKGNLRSATLTLTPKNSSGLYALYIQSTANETVPFTMNYLLDPLSETHGVIAAAFLLGCLYVLIITEIVDRTTAAMITSTLSLAVLSMFGDRPTIHELISWLDVETLLLLFSMMVLVAILVETGIFDLIAVFTFKVSRGRLWPMIILLCTLTGAFSTVLDNVTTVLLVTPVTIRLCEVTKLDPVPIVIMMVIFSNIGGTATPVGDPPNIIIVSNVDIKEAGIDFTTFTVHMTIAVLLVGLATYLQLRYFVFRNVASLRVLSEDQVLNPDSPEIQSSEIKRKISDNQISRLDTFKETLAVMQAKYKIRDKPLLIKACIALSFVICLFFLHSLPAFEKVSLGWIAFLGAILILILADRNNLGPILDKVEWATLIFFAALFVLMEALSKLGLIKFIGNATEHLIIKVEGGKTRLAVALLLILWISGLTSAFLDNIPLTSIMVRVTTSIGHNPSLKLPLSPLIWALALGVCLGGNGTLIGASANVVCAGVVEKHGYKISFLRFFKLGFPCMIGHLIVSSFYLIFCHIFLSWH